ncbi:Ribokinase-like protein [Mycena floridula]|nr:Ribokinase-like protein [Mycena floridula]
MDPETSSCSLFCLGHPLLDIQVTRGEELLIKYNLDSNGAILAEEKHLPIYADIVKNHQVTFVSGGAAQNTARGAAYVLPPNSVVFVGCVGNDDFAAQLRITNEREGLRDLYQVNEQGQTGACAVVITGQERSLVTALRSAKLLDMGHLSSPYVLPFKMTAMVYYVEGYILSHGLDSAMHLAQTAYQREKVFVLNFSAPYIPQYFKQAVQDIMPFCDIIMGNEAEAESWARANDQEDPTDIPAVARAISRLPKLSSSRPRVVIITQGAKSTVSVTSADLENHQVHPVPPLKPAEIVDTNAAGDAFAGGFLGAFVKGKSVEECIQVGHRLAAICVGQVGPQYKWPKVNIL